MQTPICDFVNKYAKDKKIRLHMPGHKGNSFLGIEEFDITEVQGADSLYEACGIIAQSEKTQVLFLTAPPFIQPKGRRSAYGLCFILRFCFLKKVAKHPLLPLQEMRTKPFLPRRLCLILVCSGFTPKVTTVTFLAAFHQIS